MSSVPPRHSLVLGWLSAIAEGARQIAENRKACAFYQYRIGFFAENNFAAHASILTLLRASSQKFPFIKLHLLNEVYFIIAGSMPSVNCLVYTIH